MKIEKLTTPQSPIIWLDTLRALATVGVIIVHVSSPLVNMSYGKNMEFWWIGNIFDSFVRYAVPLFLMLSGATLLNKEYEIGAFYKKRVFRVLLPFLFWVMIYWIFRWAMLTNLQQPKTIQEIWQWAVDLFLKEGVSKHLWYVYMILFIYLFVPFLGKGLRKLNTSSILALLLCWAIISFLCKSMPINQYSWMGSFGDKLLGYFLHSGYLVLGYYLGVHDFKDKRIRLYSAAIFFVCAMATALIVYISSKNAHRLDLSYYGYFTPFAILQTSAMFLWIKGIDIKNKFGLKLQSLISNYSYGIYLVHIMIIGLFFRQGIFWTMAHPLISIPFVTLLTIITSFVVIFILRKIPFGKYLSG